MEAKNNLHEICIKHGYDENRSDRLLRWVFEIAAQEAPVSHIGILREVARVKKLEKRINPIIRGLFFLGYASIFLAELQGEWIYSIAAVLSSCAVVGMIYRGINKASVVRLLNKTTNDLLAQWTKGMPDISEEELDFLYYVVKEGLPEGILRHKLQNRYKNLAHWELWKAKRIEAQFGTI